MSVHISLGRAIVRYNEVTEEVLQNVEFNAGSLYITPNGNLYFDSPTSNTRIHISGTITITSGIDFNECTTTARYSINTVDSTNSPLAAKGMLEVFGDTNLVFQRFTTVGGIVFNRAGFNQVGIIDWGSWKKAGES